MKEIIFVTGNRGKLAEATLALKPFGITVVGETADFLEPQTDDMQEIAVQKAVQALKLFNKPVVCEDTGIYFEAFKNFPGVYSKPLVKAVGVEGALRLLDGLQREAFFQTILCYADPQMHVVPVPFQGRVYGKVIDSPRGNAHEQMPYDFIFSPDGTGGRTFAEISAEEKNNFSHRARAFQKFGEWYAKKE
jgi:XTP/dITP diphosphohydrolase